MVDTTRDDLSSGGRHRADQIHVHHRDQKGLGPWLGLGALGLGLLALWGYGRSRAHVAGATCSETTVHFSKNEAALGPGDKIALRQLADCLKMSPSQAVHLDGRADASEAAYDGSLAHSRAEALGRELSALGVPASQYSVSMAPAPTKCTGPTDTDACWQKDRTATAVPHSTEP